MRCPVGLVAVALLAAPHFSRADEPTRRDLLEAVELKLKAVHEAAGPAVVCVVVSRNDQYPKPAKPPEHAGQLGGFDKVEFLKAGPGREALARRFDLADPAAIPDHGCAGGVVIELDEACLAAVPDERRVALTQRVQALFEQRGFAYGVSFERYRVGSAFLHFKRPGS